MLKMCWCVACATMLTVLSPCAAGAQTLPTDPLPPLPSFHVEIWGRATTDFNVRVDRYAEMRARLASRLPAEMVTNDVRQIRRLQRALAEAIRDERRGAVQGELFSVATSAEFRAILAATMTAAMWAAVMDDNPGAFGHAIDGTYPDGRAMSTMPATVLARLPQLPEGIEFRFIGRHLILYDLSANTIIDELPGGIRCTSCDD